MVGDTSNKSVSTTDPIPSATDKVCAQPMANDLKVSEAALLTEDPHSKAPGIKEIGNPPLSTESGDLK